MEYFKEPDSRIQAGMALHAGKLLAQYGDLTAHLPQHVFPARAYYPPGSPTPMHFHDKDVW